MAQQTTAPEKDSTPPRRRSHSGRVTLALIVLLVLVGYAGGGAVKFLIYAMRPPTADDVAQLVCTTLKTQNYDLLIQKINPAPVPPEATGPFNPAAIRTQLQSFDAQGGKVTSCSYMRLRYASVSGSTNNLQYAYTLRRARTSGPLSMVVIIQSDGNGGWDISRATSFAAVSS